MSVFEACFARTQHVSSLFTDRCLQKSNSILQLGMPIRTPHTLIRRFAMILLTLNSLKEDVHYFCTVSRISGVNQRIRNIGGILPAKNQKVSV